MWGAIEKYLVTFCRFYLGGFNLISGLNYFVLFWPQPRITDPTGNEYVIAAMDLNLFTYAKIFEILGGAALVFNRFVPLGLVLLMPVTVNIFLVNVPWSPLPHVQVSVTRNMLMNMFLLAAYANYFYPMLKAKATPQPVWRKPSRATKFL